MEKVEFEMIFDSNITSDAIVMSHQRKGSEE